MVKYNFKKYGSKGLHWWSSWLRICLLVQGKEVQSLDREDSTFRGATKPMHHTIEHTHPRTVLCNRRRHYSEKPVHHN